jgi:hypothetical protein
MFYVVQKRPDALPVAVQWDGSNIKEIREIVQERPFTYYSGSHTLLFSPPLTSILREPSNFLEDEEMSTELVPTGWFIIRHPNNIFEIMSSTVFERTLIVVSEREYA